MILGCRVLVLLHDEQGHPLLATTHRGDQHLTVGLPSIIARYEHHQEHVQVKGIIMDREGMATESLASLHAGGRTVVTILRTNQYQDLTSFCDVGTFLPLSIDAKGRLVREVAPARISLSRPDHQCSRARSDLHSLLASARKCDQRLFIASGVGLQPRFRQG